MRFHVVDDIIFALLLLFSTAVGFFYDRIQKTNSEKEYLATR